METCKDCNHVRVGTYDTDYLDWCPICDECEEDEYKCEKCGDIWGFSPEDYFYDESAYPVNCPLCEMPIRQMIVDVYDVEGLIAVFKRLWIRIKNL